MITWQLYVTVFFIPSMQPDLSHLALHSKLSSVSSISHHTVRPDGIINKLLINSSHSHFTFKLPRLVSHFLKIILQRVASSPAIGICLCSNLKTVKLIILHCIRTFNISQSCGLQKKIFVYLNSS